MKTSLEKSCRLLRVQCGTQDWMDSSDFNSSGFVLKRLTQFDTSKESYTKTNIYFIWIYHISIVAPTVKVIE